MKPVRAIGRGFAIAAAIAFSVVAYAYLSTPDVRALRKTNPQTTAFMELRASQAAARDEPVKRDQRWVPYSRISPNVKRAVIVTEDASFWTHGGIDYDELRDAMQTDWERGEFARGASTITQQLAKNLYLSPSKNPLRKLKEVIIARRLEAELSKQRILELYLNVIEWGDGIWGIEAAARRYFHKSAADLGAPEAALLAAAIANPRIMDPAHPSARLRRRQQMVMHRMGYVTPPPVIAEPSPAQPMPLLPQPDTPLLLPGTVVPSEKKPGRGGPGL